MFEALFKGVSTLFGLLTIEKSVENPDFIFCSSFQNLRLGSNAAAAPEHTTSNDTSASKIRISSLVPH
jgi:hypothetical protein